MLQNSFLCFFSYGIGGFNIWEWRDFNSLLMFAKLVLTHQKKCLVLSFVPWILFANFAWSSTLCVLQRSSVLLLSTRNSGGTLQRAHTSISTSIHSRMMTSEHATSPLARFGPISNSVRLRYVTAWPLNFVCALNLSFVSTINTSPLSFHSSVFSLSGWVSSAECAARMAS